MADIQALINKYAAQYGVSADLATRVARQESGFNTAAISPKGAIGVFQLMPGTASDLGVNPFVPEENIKGGIQYLSQQLQTFGGDVKKALAAYNAGPGRVKEAGGDISKLPKETRDYVRAITGEGPEYVGTPGLPGAGATGTWGESADGALGSEFGTTLAGPSTIDKVTDLFLRGVVIILGFIFVAVGLVMFKANAPTILQQAERASKSIGKKVAGK